MTVREAKRVLFLRMIQEPVSAQEKAGLEFAFGIMDMIDIADALEDIKAKKIDDNPSNAAGEIDRSDKAVEGKNTSTNKADKSADMAAGGDKVKKTVGKRAPIEKTCQECGRPYIGGKTSKYCEDCKKIVKSRKTKESNKRRRTQKALDEMEDTRLMAEELAAM